MKLEAVTTTFTGGGVGTYSQNQAFVQDVKQKENNLVNLYPEWTYESFDGFGGAVTEAAAYVYSLMNPEQKREMLEMYFGENGLNYRLLRVPVDSCDFSLEPYDSVGDPSFERAGKYIFPMLEDIYRTSARPPEIMVSPWSPPAYMKTNGSRQGGGSLKEEYYEEWAEYICSFILTLRKKGFPVKRMSVQNEAKAKMRWDSCIYTPEEEKRFIKNALYPALVRNRLEDIEIYIWDHNKERMYERAVAVIDEETDSMIAGVAFHWYSGDHFRALDLVRKQFPGKKLVLSESCLEYSRFQQGNITPGVFSLLHELIGDLEHGMNLFHDWNLCLDETGGPNYVQNNCHAPYLFHRAKQRLLPQPTLQCFYHFAHYLTPGSVRMEHSIYTEDIETTAFVRSDGTQVVILLNQTQKQLPAVLRENGRIAEITLLPESITTCCISD